MYVILIERRKDNLEERIIELFSDEDRSLMRQQIKRWRTALWILTVAALASCIVMAALTGTANASQMEFAVVAVSTVVGWIVIYGSIFIVSSKKHELSHAEMLKKEGRKRIDGEFTVTDEKVVIKHSITARKIEVICDGETKRLLVCESRADALKAADATTLYTANGYVAAYEVAK